MQDQETREFIYDFIESHGGLDAVKEDLHNVKCKFSLSNFNTQFIIDITILKNYLKLR